MIENIVSNLYSTGAFVAVLSILILVHEWGHFITAKKLGVKVEQFSLGFGPKLFSKIHEGTEYLLCAIPLGGYVKMAGDERSNSKGDSDEFLSKPPSHRALIVLNGPVVNFILAYVSFVIVFLMGFPGVSTRITKVEIAGPAYEAGLEIGDRIIALNHEKIYGWTNLEKKLLGDKKDPIAISVIRENSIIEKTVTPNIKEKFDMFGDNNVVRDLGISSLPNEIGSVIEGYPAAKYGLKEKDKILAIDNVNVFDWEDIQDAIKNSKNDLIKIKVMRANQVLEFQVKPNIETRKDEDGKDEEQRILGIAPNHVIDIFHFNVFESFTKAFELLGDITALTYKSLYKMVTGAMSFKKNVTGPVGIFYAVKGAAEEGLNHLIFMLGLISASLAIFNLLPIIPLDGGHILLLGIEKLRGKPIPEKIDEFVGKLGFSLIIVLALFVFYSDFVRFGWVDNIVGFVVKIFKFIK